MVIMLLPDLAAAADVVSPKNVRPLAKEAYIFTYPLVMNFRTMHMQAIQSDRSFGKWLHLELSSPADTDIVSPNNDTPYSYAWVDLRAEPWVLTMPKIEKHRYYTSQWDDLWGYVLDNPGSVKDGNEGYRYLLVSPSWKGKSPKGIKRIIRGESDFLGTLTRTQVLGGTQDLTRFKQIQQSYQLQPLSSFTGTKTPPAAPAIDWPEWTEGDETREGYFGYVNFLLSFISPHPDDRAVYDRMESIGIQAGTPWNPEIIDPAVRKAFQQGQADARAELKSRSKADIKPGVYLFDSRENVGTHYTDRALGVYMGIFGNVHQQANYLTMPADANGQPLDGSKATYSLTFPKGQLPPVKYFWSVTLYRLPERMLVDNPLDRYSIGSTTPGLKENADGSLTIYVSAKSPGKDKESNWLPAPEGPFWTLMRAYGPSSDILAGIWKRPDYQATSLNK